MKDPPRLFKSTLNPAGAGWSGTRSIPLPSKATRKEAIRSTWPMRRAGMKRPRVDYSAFRLSRINEPRFSHLKLLIGWAAYFALYFLTENLIPEERCHLVHTRLDELIPFCEYFVIPYVFWYLLVFGTLLYYLFYDVDSFEKLQTFIMITQAAAMLVYICWPNRQDLRPEIFPRENCFTRIISLIYAFDTPTGVCPSLHVAFSIGIASVWLKDKSAPVLWKSFVVFAVITICIATVMIKQHSVVDTFAALPVSLLAEGIVFGKPGWHSKCKLRKE